MTLSFYELLQEIEQKPGLYIGRPSITDLQIFLAGYHFARQELGIPLTDEELRFREFPCGWEGAWPEGRRRIY